MEKGLSAIVPHLGLPADDDSGYHSDFTFRQVGRRFHVRPTLHNLQALRGVACLMVFGIHLGIWESHYGISRPLLTPLLWFGYAGVDLFFVLSGFLIAHTQWASVGKPAKLPGYLFRRAWRIYPTFWVMMLLAVVLFEATGSAPPPADDDAFGRWTTWLTLWPPNAPNLYIPVAWTLPYELLFYFAFGVLLLVPRRVAPWLFVGWAAAVGIVAATTGWLNLSGYAVVRHAVNPHVWEFLLGCGIAGVADVPGTEPGPPVVVEVTGTLVVGTVGVVVGSGSPSTLKVSSPGPRIWSSVWHWPPSE